VHCKVHTLISKAFDGINYKFKPFIAPILHRAFRDASADIRLQDSSISRLVQSFDISINSLLVDIAIDPVPELWGFELADLQVGMKWDIRHVACSRQEVDAGTERASLQNILCFVLRSEKIRGSTMLR